MKQSTKIVIFFAGLVVIVLLFWLIVFRSGGGTTSEPELDNILAELSGQQVAGTPLVGSETETQDEQVIIEQLDPLTNSATDLREAENMVRGFVEIWGSVSNQDDFSSLLALDDQMTSRVRSFRDAYINDIRQTYPYTQGYFGVTTQVVSISFEDESTLASHLTAQVGTRRIESVGNSVNEYNQDVEIRLVKFADNWLVDGVFWEEL